ncbi:MAG: hypothetical protein OXU20_30910 [Myxococcales bacterium]|nr:hypothetical protein [Myxococcales bacterium]
MTASRAEWSDMDEAVYQVRLRATKRAFYFGCLAAGVAVWSCADQTSRWLNLFGFAFPSERVPYLAILVTFGACGVAQYHVTACFHSAPYRDPYISLASRMGFPFIGANSRFWARTLLMMPFGLLTQFARPAEAASWFETLRAAHFFVLVPGAVWMFEAWLPDLRHVMRKNPNRRGREALSLGRRWVVGLTIVAQMAVFIVVLSWFGDLSRMVADATGLLPGTAESPPSETGWRWGVVGAGFLAWFLLPPRKADDAPAAVEQMVSQPSPTP